MDECSCTHCYHGICFHPLRGDGAGLGVPCDGCEFDERATEPERPDEFSDSTPIMTMMLLAQFKE